MNIKTNMAAQSNTQHQCLVCRCEVDRGEKYRRRRRIDKCSHDFKVYAMMLGLKTANFDDPTFACRACFADLEKGVKTVTSLKSIATQTRISAGIDFPDVTVVIKPTQDHELGNSNSLVIRRTLVTKAHESRGYFAVQNVR